MAGIDMEGLLSQVAGGRGQENAHSAIDGAIEENELNSVLAPLLEIINNTSTEKDTINYNEDNPTLFNLLKYLIP